MNRATFKEIHDSAYQPYKLSNEINNIENFIWHDCINIGKYYGTAALHDRSHFLFTLGAVIRTE